MALLGAVLPQRLLLVEGVALDLVHTRRPHDRSPLEGLQVGHREVGDADRARLRVRVRVRGRDRGRVRVRARARVRVRVRVRVNSIPLSPTLKPIERTLPALSACSMARQVSARRAAICSRPCPSAAYSHAPG